MLIFSLSLALHQLMVMYLTNRTSVVHAINSARVSIYIATMTNGVVVLKDVLYSVSTLWYKFCALVTTPKRDGSK